MIRAREHSDAPPAGTTGTAAAVTAPFGTWSEDEVRLRLSEEFRRLRELAGLSGREIAGLLRISQSKVSRLESGGATPTLPETRAWADAVSATDDARRLLLDLTDAAHSRVMRWPSTVSGRRNLQSEVEDVERQASHIQSFELSVVPGLLQTAEYARQVFSTLDEYRDGGDINGAVAGRLQRQQALFDPDRKFHFIITEGALRWRLGTKSQLVEQLDRVRNLATLDNVKIGILPAEARTLVPITHGFTVYRFDDGRDFVTLELIHGSLQTRNSDDVKTYLLRWDKLWKSVEQGDRARALLDDMITELRGNSIATEHD